LVAAIETTDGYAYGHSLREAAYAAALADEMGLPPQQVENIRRGALLHDIGKVFVSERILRKSDELTDEEFESVRKHSALGAGVLSEVQALKDVARIVRHHHERFDGSGYPDGLADDRIPLGARVVAVVDAFGAMTTDRPYRKAMSVEEAVAELERHAGDQFDPRVVEAFLRLLQRDGPRTPAPR
jgi:putative nucleotidyltransferase with HDIG domain